MDTRTCLFFLLLLSLSLFLSTGFEMQRQSLGSPASKLQIHVGKEQKPEGGENRKEGEDGEDKKTDKLFRPTSQTNKSIHLIPLLTISCFLILYLVSHDPSQKGKQFHCRGLRSTDSRAPLLQISSFNLVSAPFRADLVNIGGFERISLPKGKMQVERSRF